MSQLDSFPLNDWGSIALICACHVGQNISNIKDLNGKGFKMDESKPRQINFVCADCRNSFDYDVKIKLFELLKKYYKTHNQFDGFSHYITRKGERIRLKYIKTITHETEYSKKEIIIIEAANLTTHPRFKLTHI